jgi:HD superfamily phosphohydrolase
MVGDAIENCIKAFDNFNPELYNNPFAYFTQIASFAFLRRIEMEKKQQYVKFKMLEELPVDEMIEFQDESGESQYRSVVDYMREHSYFDTKSFEDKKAANKKKKTVIEEVMEES